MAGHSDNDMALPTFEDPVKVLIVIAPYYTKISKQQLASARAISTARRDARDHRSAGFAEIADGRRIWRTGCATLTAMSRLVA